MPGLKCPPPPRTRKHTFLPLSFLQQGHRLHEAFPDPATLSHVIGCSQECRESLSCSPYCVM